MRVSAFLAGALAAAAAFSAGAGAMADQGPKILTAGGKAERSSMTPGVAYASVKGVNLYKGKAQTPAAADDALLGGGAAPVKCNVVVKVEKYTWRRFRHLRTQGFYSGDPYRSRPYTQGFYSSGR